MYELFFLQNPGTELEESYLKFVKLNLERFRAHLNDEKMKKQLIKVRSYSQRVVLFCKTVVLSLGCFKGIGF